MGNPFVDEPATREARVVQRTFELVAGGVLLLCGVPVLAFMTWALAAAAWTAIRTGTLPAGTTSMQATVMACFLALAIFFTQVGFRLVWHRPNAHGSLLSPGGWATLAFVFAGVAAAMSIAVVRAGGRDANRTGPRSAAVRRGLPARGEAGAPADTAPALRRPAWRGCPGSARSPRPAAVGSASRPRTPPGGRGDRT